MRYGNCMLRVWLGLLPFVGQAACATELDDLFDMGLDQLTRLKVVSVQRTQKPLFQTAAAVYVVTREEIVASGAESIVDLLHKVPGVSVRYLSRHRTSVAIRNDNQLFLSDSVVLIDGQSIYSPYTHAYFWESFDLPLSDIERIEIIRGGGSVVWGANAASGVINILTRHSQDSHATTVRVEAGSQQWQAVQGQTGHQGERLGWRLSARHQQDAGYSLGGYEANEARRNVLGARLDWQGTHWRAIFNARHLDRTNQDVSVFTGRQAESDVQGRALFLKLSGDIAEGQSVEWRTAWSRLSSSLFSLNIDSEFDALDNELLYHWDNAWGQTLAGVSWRRFFLASSGTSQLFYEGDDNHLTLAAAFVNHSLVLDDAWALGLGFRHEYFDLTRDDARHASLKLQYVPDSQWQLWASLNYMEQFPSFNQARVVITAAQVTEPVPALLTQRGNPELEPEQIRELQWGVRWQGRSNFLDVTAYWVRHRDQVYVNPETTEIVPAEPLSRLNQYFDNFVGSRTAGIEVSWRHQRHGGYSEVNAGYFHRESFNESTREQARSYFPERKVSWTLSLRDVLGGSFHSVLAWEAAVWSENGAGLFAQQNSFVRMGELTRWDVSYQYPVYPGWRLGVVLKNLFNEEVNWDYPVGQTPAQAMKPGFVVSVDITL